MLKTYIAYNIIVVCSIAMVSSQVRVPFTQRPSNNTPRELIYKTNGDFTLIGNTNLTLNNYGLNTNNSLNQMIFVDTDGDIATENSSSSTLLFSDENGASADCHTVLFAGLYWTGRDDGTFDDIDRRAIKFKTPNDTDYNLLTAAPDAIRFPGDSGMYVGYVEVTDAVNAAGSGEYWVADLALNEGNGGGIGFFGGWGMVVVYENPRMTPRDITVFDGYALINGSTNVNDYNLDIIGFETIPIGPVNAKLGVIASEGDVGLAGDFLKIRNAADTDWVDLSHSTNSTTNFFNSSINTGGNPRNPMLQNNTGIDISFFEIDNANNQLIANSQTQTTFQYGTNSDTYVIFSLAMSVETFITDVEGVMSISEINGNPPTTSLALNPNDEFEFSLDIKNKGSEPIDNFVLNIPIPPTAEFVEGSISYDVDTLVTLNSIPQYSEASNAVVWDFGTLPLSITDIDLVLATLTFKMTATTNCDLLINPSCSPTIPLAGTITGTGAITGSDLDYELIQGYNDINCNSSPIETPLNIAIDAVNYVQNNCQSVIDSRNFEFCTTPTDTIDFDTIASAYPSGTQFYSYDSGEVTQNNSIYTIDNPFPNITGTTTYLAVLPNTTTACPYPFTIHIEQILASASITNSTCLSNGGISITVSDTTASYIYNWSSSDGGNGIVQGTQNQNTLTAGTYSVVITNTNSQCSLRLDSLTIIEDPNTIPTINAPSEEITSGCGILDILNYSDTEAIISEEDFIALGGTVSYNNGIQSLIYIDTLIGSCPTRVERTFTITDTCNKVATATQNIVLTDTIAPVLYNLPEASVTASCDTIPEIPTLTVTDNCDTAVGIQYQELSNTVANGCGEIIRQWTAEDACGNTTSFTQTITVIDTAAPILSNVPEAYITVECGNLPPLPQLTVIDNCDASVVIDFEEIDDTIATNGCRRILRNWTATDTCGNSTVFTQNITVIDTSAPVLEHIPNASITVACANIPTPEQLTAKDDCDTSVTVTFEELNNTVSNGCGNIIRQWTATDTCGNTDTFTQTITVTDTIAPVLSNLPEAFIIVDCNTIPPPAKPTVNDNCDPIPSINFKEDIAFFEDSSHTIVRTWFATDACGNTTQPYTQRIEVITTVETSNIIDICIEDAPIDLDDYQIETSYPNTVQWEGNDNTLIEEGHVFNPANARIDETYTYTKRHEDTSKCTFETSVSIRVNDNCVYYPCVRHSEDVFISKMVTPNNDGINDTFKVEYTLNPQSNENCNIIIAVQVYTRLGELVFESSDYQNNWEGNATSVTSTSTYLPSGTYYYIVDLSGVDFEPIQGYILLGID